LGYSTTGYRSKEGKEARQENESPVAFVTSD
jgi:hypothetical protein